MIFTELRFVPFFAVVLVVHWALRGPVARKVWLLAASYVFYAAWDPRFLGLIGLASAIAWGAGALLEREQRAGRRRLVTGAAVAGALGILAAFKYLDFFVASGGQFLAFLGLPMHPASLEIVLPVGISFYVFQVVSYIVDVSRRTLPRPAAALDTALFVGFFPQLVAGPIMRAVDLVPQLQRAVSFASVRIRASVWIFCIGYFKKAIVSDQLAPRIDLYFANPEAFDAASAWLAMGLYSIQIYCDFSGYSDMAVGCAGLLGYNLYRNFDFPYLSPNITIFWRRWHQSLSSWLRDYLYIPLGGSRGSGAATYRNLMTTMLLGGLWHGAAWHFVLWGGLHGGALAAHRAWATDRSGAGQLGVRAVAGIGATYALVCVGWVFFRAESASVATSILANLAGLGAGVASLPPALWGAWGILAAAHVLAWRIRPGRHVERIPPLIFATAIGAGMAGILCWAAPEAAPFIYFQF